MQVIDWSQLKDGSVFKVVGPFAPETSYPQGLTYGEGAVYKVSGGQYKLLDYEYSRSGGTTSQHIAIKQTVQIPDTKEELRQLEVQGLVTRVGLTTGTDPEIFVTHGKGELFPAFKFLQPQATVAKSKTDFQALCVSRWIRRRVLYKAAVLPWVYDGLHPGWAL